MSSSIHTFQLVSDLHLEFYQEEQPIETFLKPVAQNLIVAGDLGNPQLPSFKNFFCKASKLFQRVFYVAGNHEFYRSTLNKTIETITQQLSEFENVYFLDNSVYECDQFVVLGTTLWSYVDPDDQPYIKQAISDYRLIESKENYTLRVQDTVDLYTDNVKWLKEQIEEYKPKEKPVIIVTHHLISDKLVPQQYKGHRMNTAFMSDLDDELLGNNTHVKVVCSGHTHFSFNETSGNATTKLLVNPRGYNYEVNPKYDPSFQFSL